MPHIAEALTGPFPVDGTRAQYIAVPEGSSVTVSNSGNTLYYADTPDVTSSSNDGSIATAASATFTTGQFVIAGQGLLTNVFAKTNETVTTSDLTVTDDVTFGDAVSQSAASPRAIQNWPATAADSGTDTTPADGTMFVTNIFVPSSKTITGVGWLVGSVGGTDRVVVSLWSTAGVNLAQSTTTSNGTVAGTTATYQEIAFTAPYVAQGPAHYFVGVAAKGTTARLRTVPAVVGPGLLAGEVTQTHGATTAITPPSTFTAGDGPIVYLY